MNCLQNWTWQRGFNLTALSQHQMRRCTLRTYTQRQSCGCNGRAWMRMPGHSWVSCAADGKVLRIPQC